MNTPIIHVILINKRETNILPENCKDGLHFNIWIYDEDTIPKLGNFTLVKNIKKHAKISLKSINQSYVYIKKKSYHILGAIKTQGFSQLSANYYLCNSTKLE